MRSTTFAERRRHTSFMVLLALTEGTMGEIDFHRVAAFHERAHNFFGFFSILKIKALGINDAD
jgi:hypothetical protein